MAAILSNLFRQPHGYLITTDPDPARGRGQEAVVEASTVTCGHCGSLVKVPAMCKPEQMPYALCWGCRRNICASCDHERSKTLKCDVIENKLERWEARDRFLREVG